MKKTIRDQMTIVMTIMALGVLAISVLQPMLPLYLTSIGVTPEILGLMLSVAMAGMVIGESLWGWLADKVGVKIPMSAGTFISSLLVFCFVLTQHIPAIFTIFFFWGLLRSALFGSGRGYIGANAPPSKKATFMAFITVMMSASRSIGALPSGFVADNWGFQTVFFISCGISLFGGMAVVIGLRKTQLLKLEPPAIAPAPTDENPSTAQKVSYHPLTYQCVVTIFQFFGLGTLITFLPLLATQVIGVTSSEVGILFTIRGLSAMVLGIPMGLLADRKGKRAFMILGLLVSAAAMAGMAFSESFPWLIVFVIVSSLGLTMFSPAALGLVSDSVPLHLQSTAMGIYGGVCENIGIIAGSSLGGFAWSAWGPQATFLMGTVASILGVVICLGLVRDKASNNL
ncbi:putative MFS-type transporter YfcJ [subsurface metagenome]